MQFHKENMDILFGRGRTQIPAKYQIIATMHGMKAAQKEVVEREFSKIFNLKSGVGRFIPLDKTAFAAMEDYSAYIT